uniref:Cytochrome P450 n=1 Tax=Acrobeloides nanus TaxID=290746 RepID=A0A914DBH0_9BILA
MMEFLSKETSIEGFDLSVYFREYTADIICRIALGQQETMQFKNNFAEEVTKASDAITQSKLATTCVLFPWEIPVWILRRLLIIPAIIGKNPIIKLFIDIGKVIEKKRKIRGSEQENSEINFIDFLLDAEVGESDVNFEGENSPKKGFLKRLTSDEIIGACVLFLFAGFDTSSSTLSIISYFLAKNPEIQTKVQNELDVIFLENEIFYEDLQKLKYMDAVIKETLRLYPVSALFVNFYFNEGMAS